MVTSANDVWVAVRQIPDLHVHHEIAHVRLVEQQRRHGDERGAVVGDACGEIQLRQKSRPEQRGREHVGQLDGRLRRGHQ